MSDNLYNEKIMDRFLNPKNIGKVDNENAMSEVGAASCGDVLKVSLRINETSGIIEEAKALIFGCATAISSADMAMDLIRGRTVDDVEKNFTNDSVLDALGGADEWKAKMPQKIHCSVLAESAIQEALENYKKKKNL